DNDGAYDDATSGTASRSFATPGTYIVGLKVTDDSGASTTVSHTVTVANRPPVVGWTSAPAAPKTGDSVTFTSTASDPDGTIASRSFAKAGIYTVGLKVTDDNGDSATVQHTVTVTNRAPSAAFEISPNPTSSQQTVSFTSTSTDPDGTIASHAWDLNGDGK